MNDNRKTFDRIVDKYGLSDQCGYTPGKGADAVVEIPGQTRNMFALLLAQLGLRRGAEIGVEAGLYSEVLCQSIPGLELYCVDAWKAYSGYRDHTSQSVMEDLYWKASRRLRGYGAEIVREFSMDAVKHFNDNTLDFVYIDGNHEFRHVVDDICEWTKKVRPGGIVAGHDYIRRKGTGYLMHVMPAVHAYCDAYNIKPLFVLGRKSEDPQFRDRVRSWFFVKPDPEAIVPGSGHKIPDLT